MFYSILLSIIIFLSKTFSDLSAGKPFQLEPIMLQAPIVPRHLVGEPWFTFNLSLHRFELNLKNSCSACLNNSSNKNRHQHTAVPFCPLCPYMYSVWSRLRDCTDFVQDSNLSHKVIMNWLTQTVVMWLRLIMGFYDALCACPAFPKTQPHSGVLGLSPHLANTVDSKKPFFKSGVYTCSQ